MADTPASGDDSLAERLAEALPRLTPEQIAQVSPNFKRESYNPGQVIIRQGDPPECFYIVLRGRTEVLHDSMSGQRQHVDVHTSGSTFGEIGLLKNQPRTATVRAGAEGAVLLSLERDDFLTLVSDSRATENQVTQNLIRHMINLAGYQD